MEVGEVADPEPVEGRGKPGNLDLEHARAEPARLEPAVGESADTGNERQTEDDHPRTLESKLCVPTTLLDVGSPQDEPEPLGLRHGMFVAWLATTAALVLAQSVVHLALALGADRIGTELDLDRSNGVPDLVSTVVLASATFGAVALTWVEAGRERLAAAIAACLLAVITLADLLHDGAHPARSGFLVIAFVVGTVAMLAVIGRTASARVRMTLAVGVCLLAGSFFVSGLDRITDDWLDRDWFDKDRGDAVEELRIVFKEGFELAGWSLVALGLWDVFAERRAAARESVTPRLEPRHDP